MPALTPLLRVRRSCALLAALRLRLREEYDSFFSRAPAQAVHIALQVARALEYLHPTIIHRDLKVRLLRLVAGSGLRIGARPCNRRVDPFTTSTRHALLVQHFILTRALADPYTPARRPLAPQRHTRTARKCAHLKRGRE